MSVKEELARPSISPPLEGTRWREQSGVGENEPAAPGWIIFTSGVTLKPCGCIFSPA